MESKGLVRKVSDGPDLYFLFHLANEAKSFKNVAIVSDKTWNESQIFFFKDTVFKVTQNKYFANLYKSTSWSEYPRSSYRKEFAWLS